MASKNARQAVPKHCLSQQLRDFIQQRGDSAYAVARAAAVDRGIVSRFLSGERTITLDTADRLASAMGLRLVETGRIARRKPSPTMTLPSAEPPEGYGCGGFGNSGTSGFGENSVTENH